MLVDFTRRHGTSAMSTDDGNLTKLAYGVQEFGAVAGLGRTKVYAEIAAGRLRAKKAGRRTIILAEDARAYLASLPELPSAA